MSIYALKIFSACPSSILHEAIYTRFGSSSGVMLIDIPSKLDTHDTTWNGNTLSDEQVCKYKDALDYLHHTNALIFCKGNEKQSSLASPLKSLGNALDNNSCNIEYAICEDAVSIKQSVSHLLIDRHTALTKRVFDHKKIDVDMSARALKEALTPFAFKCSTYKIIDPYIFELTVNDVETRVEFLLELCKALLEYDDVNTDEVSIEIFGRSFKYKSSGGKEFVSEASLRNALSTVRRLKEYSDELDIKFVGLDDTATADKIHLRYLYTEKYLFAVEHSFETRKGKMQKVWFDTTEDLATFQRRYREQSIDFDVSFSFYADEVF